MKPIWVKDANTEFEAQECAEWITRIADINLFDKRVLLYPTTKILRAYQEENGERSSCLYMPEQTVRVLESLAPKPGSEGTMEAAALKAIMSDVISRAERDGIRELMFQCSDERVHQFIKKYGWYESKIPLFRYRIADRERQ